MAYDLQTGKTEEMLQMSRMLQRCVELRRWIWGDRSLTGVAGSRAVNKNNINGAIGVSLN